MREVNKRKKQQTLYMVVKAVKPEDNPKIRQY